jgi:hypothetical protein
MRLGGVKSLGPSLGQVYNGGSSMWARSPKPMRWPEPVSHGLVYIHRSDYPNAIDPTARRGSRKHNTHTLFALPNTQLTQAKEKTQLTPPPPPGVVPHSLTFPLERSSLPTGGRDVSPIPLFLATGMSAREDPRRQVAMVALVPATPRPGERARRTRPAGGARPGRQKLAAAQTGGGGAWSTSCWSPPRASAAGVRGEILQVTTSPSSSCCCPPPRPGAARSAGQVSLSSS